MTRIRAPMGAEAGPCECPAGAVLYLPDGDRDACGENGGFLSLVTAGGGEIVVMLTAALVRVLLAFRQARAEDAADPRITTLAEGWRRAETIAEDIAADDPFRIPTEAATLRHYCSLIKRLIREAAERADEEHIPAVFEHLRGIGTRLAVDLTVIRGPRRRDARCRDHAAPTMGAMATDSFP